MALNFNFEKQRVIFLLIKKLSILLAAMHRKMTIRVQFDIMRELFFKPQA